MRLSLLAATGLCAFSHARPISIDEVLLPSFLPSLPPSWYSDLIFPSFLPFITCIPSFLHIPSFTFLSSFTFLPSFVFLPFIPTIVPSFLPFLPSVHASTAVRSQKDGTTPGQQPRGGVLPLPPLRGKGFPRLEAASDDRQRCEKERSR